MAKLKCALTSDLHAGFSEKTYEIHENFFKKLAKEEIDILFLAGDVISSKQEEFELIFSQIRRHLPNCLIFFNKGNHDLWNNKYNLGSDPYGDVYSYYRKRRIKLRYLSEAKRPISYFELIERQKEILSKYNIIYLDGKSYSISDNLIIIGFDGWYNEVNQQNLQTNDYRFLPEMIESAPVHVFLRNKAENDLEKILRIPTEEKTVVCMTHFPPFTEDVRYEKWCANLKFMDFLTEKSDYLLVGHSHKGADFIYKDCRVLNAGIDESIGKKEDRYDKPNYILFDLDS